VPDVMSKPSKAFASPVIASTFAEPAPSQVEGVLALTNLLLSLRAAGEAIPSSTLSPSSPLHPCTSALLHPHHIDRNWKENQHASTVGALPNCFHCHALCSSACATRSITLGQSLGRVCRHSRMVGYHGVVSPSNPQRQSGT